MPHGGLETPIAVMLAFPIGEVASLAAQLAALPGLQPRQPQEPPSPLHLVLAVHQDGVVALGALQRVVPGRGRIIAVSSGIQGHVLAPPPHVHVQRIGLRGPVSEARTMDENEALFSPQGVAAAVLGGEIAGRRRLRRRGCGSGAKEPEKILIPRSGGKGPDPVQGVSGCLHDGSEVLIIAIAQRQDQGPIIMSVAGDAASLGHPGSGSRKSAAIPTRPRNASLSGAAFSAPSRMAQR